MIGKKRKKIIIYNIELRDIWIRGISAQEIEKIRVSVKNKADPYLLKSLKAPNHLE
jgi:hypothetical protein